MRFIGAIDAPGPTVSGKALPSATPSGTSMACKRGVPRGVDLPLFLAPSRMFLSAAR